MAVTTAIGWVGAVSGASGFTLTLTLTFAPILIFIVFIFRWLSAACCGSGPAFLLLVESRHLREVLLAEGRKGFVQGHGRHTDLLGGLETLVCGLEDGFVSLFSEFSITDVSTNIYW